MANIALLDQNTIDKIAAGEVIERPASVVKELVENAIDAGATAVTVEIKEGGVSLIRVTDNGCGIAKEETPLAFLRHSTSKIRQVEDLLCVTSLGFRGEALSSIAAVSQVELITKRKESLMGVRYTIEGGTETGLEDIGAPEGTTFLVRKLFYNVPARRKFLKSQATEAGYINDLLERLAISRPDISFKFIHNGQTKIHTAGNTNLKDTVYHIFGRDIAANLIQVEREMPGIRITGFIGKPVVSRGNRNYENYFVNGRYVKSSLLAKAIEEGYKTFMMQHKYPFTALHFTVDGKLLDINVHPTKMELRFSNNEEVYQFVFDTIREGLTRKELIPEVKLTPEKSPVKAKLAPAPEPFEKKRMEAGITEKRKAAEEEKGGYKTEYKMAAPVREEPVSKIAMMFQEAEAKYGGKQDGKTKDSPLKVSPGEAKAKPGEEKAVSDLPFAGQDREAKSEIKKAEKKPEAKPEQTELFDGKLLAEEAREKHRIIGQIFGTYWLVEYQEKLYIIDQHAAHEKVLYERTLKSLRNKEFTSQMLSPPIVLTLSMQEEELLKRYMDNFARIGFEIEPFGGKEYAVRAVPDNLFSIAQKDLLMEMLDSLEEGMGRNTPEIIDEKIASMSCKAAVKGNHTLSLAEAQALIDELLTLENPYNCPHGRPTIISMTKYELERKFKRIV